MRATTPFFRASNATRRMRPWQAASASAFASVSIIAPLNGQTNGRCTLIGNKRMCGPLTGAACYGPWLGLLLGALAAALAPFGDFAVSLFKRMAQIKDSSQLIPGHGGVLDRLDSLLFIFPMVTYFAIIVAGP